MGERRQAFHETTHSIGFVSNDEHWRVDPIGSSGAEEFDNELSGLNPSGDIRPASSFPLAARRSLARAPRTVNALNCTQINPRNYFVSPCDGVVVQWFTHPFDCSTRRLHSLDGRRAFQLADGREPNEQMLSFQIWILVVSGCSSELKAAERMTAARSRSRSFRSPARRMRIEWRGFCEIFTLLSARRRQRAPKCNRKAF